MCQRSQETRQKNMDELALIMKETPSRVEIYGAQILKILGAKNAD